MIARLSTLTARPTVSSKMKSSTSDWMLPSKIRPITSPLAFTTGEPLLPPMMSAVHTKLNGVFRSIFSLRSTHRFGSSKGPLLCCSLLRS